MLFKVTIVVVVALFSAIYFYLQDYLLIYGFLEDVVPYNQRGCDMIDHDQLKGCESIAIHEKTGIAFLACESPLERWKWLPSIGNMDYSAKETGRIYTFDPKTKEVTPLKFLNFPREAIHLLGLSIIYNAASAESNSITLAIVHHPKNQTHAIELFSHVIGSKDLTHIESVMDAAIMARPNSVHLMSSSSFYVSVDSKYDSPLLKSLERMLRLDTGHVSFRDTKGKMRIVTSNVNFANGIAQSADGTHLYVASTTKGLIKIYQRTLSNGLRFLDQVRLPFIVDNLTLDPATDMIHVSGFSTNFLNFIGDPLNKSCATMAAKVYEDKDDTFFGRKFKYKIVFSDDGSLISGVSVLAVSSTHNYSLMGTLFSSTLFCDRALQ